jgi:hypothetical protein
MQEPKHTTTRHTKTIDVDTDRITTRVYTHRLNNEKLETEQRTMSDQAHILGDYMGCLDVITKNQTDELTVVIKREGKSIRIKKIWTESFERM